MYNIVCKYMGQRRPERDVHASLLGRLFLKEIDHAEDK